MYSEVEPYLQRRTQHLRTVLKHDRVVSGDDRRSIGGVRKIVGLLRPKTRDVVGPRIAQIPLKTIHPSADLGELGNVARPLRRRIERIFLCGRKFWFVRAFEMQRKRANRRAVAIEERQAKRRATVIRYRQVEKDGRAVLWVLAEVRNVKVGAPVSLRKPCRLRREELGVGDAKGGLASELLEQRNVVHDPEGSAMRCGDELPFSRIDRKVAHLHAR